MFTICSAVDDHHTACNLTMCNSIHRKEIAAWRFWNSPCKARHTISHGIFSSCDNRHTDKYGSAFILSHNRVVSSCERVRFQPDLGLNRSIVHFIIDLSGASSSMFYTSSSGSNALQWMLILIKKNRLSTFFNFAYSKWAKTSKVAWLIVSCSWMYNELKNKYFINGCNDHYFCPAVFGISRILGHLVYKFTEDISKEIDNTHS